jgi:hypothetical protein
MSITSSEKLDAVVAQIEVIRRLAQSEKLRVKRDGKWVKIPKWEAVDGELLALRDFCLRDSEATN